MSDISIFDRIAAKYNNTKPISGSATPKELDVRPWGERRRKWERIVKYDQDTYYVTDSHNTWLMLHPRENWPQWATNGSASADEIYEMMCEDEYRLAPVLVKREYGAGHKPYTSIRVRNPHKGMVGASFRYFLSEVLWELCKLSFDRIGNSRTSAHYGIHSDSFAIPYYLPKSTMDTLWQSVTPTYGAQVPRMGNEDYSYLLFREVNGSVELDERSPVHKKPKTVVDKETKAQYREQIKEFTEHALAVGGLLMEQDYAGVPNVDLFGIAPHQYPRPSNALATEMVRSILKNPEHEKRMVLAGCLLRATDYFDHKRKWDGWSSMRWEENPNYVAGGSNRFIQVPVKYPPYTEEEQKAAYKQVRAQINRLLNKWAEFTKTVTEEN